MLALEDRYLGEVKEILRKWLPKHEILAFGSRVHQRGLKPFSDLDLVVMTDQPLDTSVYGLVKEAFAESNLPFRVDLADWSLLSHSFQQIILSEYEKIQ